MNTHHQNLYPQTLSRYSRYALLAWTLMMRSEEHTSELQSHMDLGLRGWG